MNLRGTASISLAIGSVLSNAMYFSDSLVVFSLFVQKDQCAR